MTSRRLFDRLPDTMHPKRSLMARLVGSFLTVSVLTVVFVAFVAFVEARRALREAAAERLMTVAVEKNGELNRWVELQRDLIVFVAGLPGLRVDASRMGEEHSRDEARARIESLLRSAIESRPSMEELFVLSPVGGRVIASTDTTRLGNYRVADLFYTRGKKETFIQNVYTSPITGNPAFTIATPIRNDAGETIAVLAGDLDLAHVDRLIADRTGLGTTGQAYLVSAFNDFVSSERFGRDEFRRGVFSEGISAALGGDNGVGVYANYEGTPVIGAYRWSAKRDLALLVEMDQAEAFAPARRLVVTILGIGLVSALMLAFGVFLIARQIARPVLAVAEAATAVAEGDFATVAPVLTSDEVGVLAAAFNDMTGRLRRLYADLNEQVETTTAATVALEESQHLLQAITDNSTTLIAVTDPEDRFLLVNKSFEKVMGIDQDEALHRSPRALLPAEVAEPYVATTRTAWAEQRVAERELSFLADGERRTYFLVAFPLRAAGSAPYGVGVVATDLTDVKRAQHVRAELEAQVQHAQKLESLGLMAGGIAHDFNNVLTSLLGNTELAAQFVEDGSKASKYLDRVVTATKQASNLTSQMLAYAGKASFHQELLELNAVVREMTELVRASIPKKITFRTDLVESETTIETNRAQLSQLVMNLVTNAAEAVGQGAGCVTVRTGAEADDPGTVWLEVSDTGVGMDDKTRERIFDPFFSTKGPGRGLGLAAVQGIVRSAGGELTVSSTLGEGSTFDVRFPRARRALAVDQEAAAGEEGFAGHGKILVVDDEPMVRHAARNLLEAAGFSVIECKNGLEAVDLYREKRGEIDAVILDMTMPGMSGAEALDAIRGIDGNAPVILTSGYDREDTAAYLRELESVEFLQKPYRARTLFAKLARVLKSQEALKH